VKILVATPVYDGKLPVETVRSLLNEQAVANGSGDEIQVRFLPACSHPAMGRNQLAQDFLDSDADRLDTPQLWANEYGLLEVTTLPGGFLSLSRKVFETLKAAHPERGYEHFGNQAHCYFQMLFTEGHLFGEDSYFCKEWRDTGGKVFLDPELTLTHWDFNRPFKGHIGNWLKGRAIAAAQAS
jgi:hypothetical protein